MAIQFIEVIEQEHIDQVARLAKVIWQEHYPPIIGQSQVEYMLDKFQSPQAIQQQLDVGYQYFLLATETDFAGYLSILCDQQVCSMQLSKIYVLKDYRCAGLGRSSIEYLIEYGHSLGIKSLWLTVNRHNEAALSFYHRMGFSRSGTVVQDIGRGFVMDDFSLIKKITVL